VPKYSSKLRFSCMMNTKCWIFSRPGGIGGGAVATDPACGAGVLTTTLSVPSTINGAPEGEFVICDCVEAPGEAVAPARDDVVVGVAVREGVAVEGAASGGIAQELSTLIASANIAHTAGSFFLNWLSKFRSPATGFQDTWHTAGKIRAEPRHCAVPRTTLIAARSREGPHGHPVAPPSVSRARPAQSRDLPLNRYACAPPPAAV